MFYLSKYNIIKTNQKDLYSFTSKGINGDHHLFAKFKTSYIKNIYQFEFGPLKQATNSIDTSFIIHNRDTDCIISTVTYIIYLFLKANPDGIVRFCGSTEARSRLFSMWIGKNCKEMHRIFLIYGCTVNIKWERFKKNNRYNAILLKLNPSYNVEI